MNKNLFLKEMKRSSVSLITWMIVLILLISVTMGVYPTFIENQSKIMAMLSIIPKGALQFKGITDFNALLSVLGFYAANNVIYMMVLGSIFSIVLASNILLREEYEKTAEFLLSWPVSRNEIFLGKSAVLFLDIFLLNFVTSLAGFTWMILLKTAPFNTGSFLILSFYTFLLNLLFGATGLFLSTLVKRAKPITTFAISLVLIFYFIDTLSKITQGISKLGYLSPFRYADINAVSPGYTLNYLNLLYFAGLTLLLATLAWSNYRKKDIYL